VSGNLARGNGGYLSGGGNGGDALGGGIYSTISLSATASSIITNQAIGGIGSDGSHIPSVAAGKGGHASGGGVWFTGAATLTSCTLANNRSQGGLGGQAFGFPI